MNTVLHYLPLCSTFLWKFCIFIVIYIYFLQRLLPWQRILYCYYAAVLAGHNTRFARLFVRLSVCLSVLYGLLSRKQKDAEKPRLVWTFPWPGVGGLPIFGSKDERSGGRPHSMSASFSSYCWENICFVCIQVTITTPEDPAYPPDEIYGIVGDNLKKTYDVKEVD